MSKYGIIYRMTFQNVEQQNITVDIYDLSYLVDDAVPVQVFEMTGTGDPFRTSIIDTSEEKFTVVKSTQATIKFLSSDTVNLSTFADGPIPSGGTDPGDPRFLVHAYVNSSSKYIFKGYLNIHDCSEMFMPYGFEVTLTATDGLGWMRDTPLVNMEGVTPRGYHRMIDFIAWALQATKQDLFINVVFNIRHEDFQNDHLFDIAYLHSKSFEEEIAACHNCYEVIEKILGDQAFLCQRSGEWWIFRVDEMEAGLVYRTKFDAVGDIVSVHAGTNYDHTIEKDSVMFFSQEATSVPVVRPYRFIKDTYNFSLPQEILDNINFERGNLANYNSGTQTGNYTVDDWTLERVTGSTEIFAYIRKIFVDANQTYVEEKYLVLTTGATALHWLKSNPVYLHEKDKLNISLDWRLDSNQSGSGSVTENVAQLRLYADDGTYYTCTNDPQGNEGEGEWIECNAAFTTNQRYIEHTYTNNQTDQSEWQQAEIQTKPLPKSGEVRLLLNASSVWGNTVETHFQNIRFDYVPYLYGSYSQFEGRHHKVSRTENYVSTREVEVYVSDSPKKLFKGGIHIDDGAGNKIVGEDRFYNGAVYTSTPPAEAIHPYAHIQAFDVWNQYRNPVRKFEATVQGLKSSTTDVNGYVNTPSLIHRYILADTHLHTINRYFMLLTFDIDWYLCEWKGTLIEVYNSDTGKHYDDDLEIKLL